MSDKEMQMSMYGKKIKALYLSGSSISEVAYSMNLSSSGIAYHLKKMNVKMRERSGAVLLKHHKRLDSFSSNIPKKISAKFRNLYLVSLALYWGEGSKTGNTIAITNSDPDIILLFLGFLRKICQIDEKRLRILIHYHPDQNECQLVTYWSNLTKISESQFYKSTLHRGNNKKSTNRLKFGTISLRYSDSLLHKELLSRIEELKNIDKPL